MLFPVPQSCLSNLLLAIADNTLHNITMVCLHKPVNLYEMTNIIHQSCIYIFKKIVVYVQFDI